MRRNLTIKSNKSAEAGKRFFTRFVSVYCILLLIFTHVNAQLIQWQKTIGGSDNDYLYSIQQTSDSGYILGGYSNSSISGDKTENCIGDFDYWIVKIDSAGNIQWQNTIGGSGQDQLYSIQQTGDGGYILGGFSDSNISGDKTENCIGDRDYWMVKTDSLGNIEWQNTIGGSDDDYLTSIRQNSDGGYILGGWSNSNISGDKSENHLGSNDYWIVKTDSLGNIQWQNTIGGSGIDRLHSIKQTSDGGYILGGESSSNISGDKTENNLGSTDYWIIKTDSQGIIQWQNTIGGGSLDQLYSIRQTSDGGYIFGGWSYSNISGDKTENNIGGMDYWIVKTDSLGNIQWQNTIGGSNEDYLNSIQQTSDGGYILGGDSWSNISGDKTENNNGSRDYWIVNVDSSGNIQWQNTIGGSGKDQLYSIQQTGEGGYILGGFSDSNISGDKTEDNIGLGDYWIVKLTGNNFPTGISSASTSADKLLVFPNPADNSIGISGIQLENGKAPLRLMDVYGKLIIEKTVSEITANLNIDHLAKGVYLIQSGGSRATFIKQ